MKSITTVASTKITNSNKQAARRRTTVVNQRGLAASGRAADDDRRRASVQRRLARGARRSARGATIHESALQGGRPTTIGGARRKTVKLPASVARRASKQRRKAARVWLAPRLRCAAGRDEGDQAGNFALTMLGSGRPAPSSGLAGSHASD